MKFGDGEVEITEKQKNDLLSRYVLAGSGALLGNDFGIDYLVNGLSMLRKTAMFKGIVKKSVGEVMYQKKRYEWRRRDSVGGLFEIVESVDSDGVRIMESTFGDAYDRFSAVAGISAARLRDAYQEFWSVNVSCDMSSCLSRIYTSHVILCATELMMRRRFQEMDGGFFYLPDFVTDRYYRSRYSVVTIETMKEATVAMFSCRQLIVSLVRLMSRIEDVLGAFEITDRIHSAIGALQDCLYSPRLILTSCGMKYTVETGKEAKDGE